MGSQITQLALVFLIWAVLACFSSCHPSEFSTLDDDLKEFPSADRVFRLFQIWKEKYQKVYKDGAEEELRFSNFQTSLKHVVERNLMRKSRHEHFLGLNKFSDMSHEEFAEMYLSKLKIPERTKERTTQWNWAERRCNAPPSLNWADKGVVTPPKHQGRCGSCWAFSASGAIEGIHAIVTGELVSLSEQQIVSCAGADGCRGGWMTDAFRYVIYNRGIAREEYYPYTARDGPCYYMMGPAVTIDGYEEVEQSDNGLLCATINQPISVAISAGGALDLMFYRNGTYDGSCSNSRYFVDHAVLIVGYDTDGDGNKYWIVKNSWGSEWGMDGYIHIKRDDNLPHGKCAINYYASYPTINRRYPWNN